MGAHLVKTGLLALSLMMTVGETQTATAAPVLNPIGQAGKIDVKNQKFVKLSIKKNDLICGANNDGDFAYLHNQSTMTLEVTIKAAETDRKFPRKRKYVMQPDQEIRIGCTKSAYKQDVEFTYTLFKIKQTNYLQQRKF